MFEVFEHTADLGLRVRSPSLETLLEEAASGLTSVIVANLSDIRAVETCTIEVEGQQPDLLLFDLLTEVLFEFESSQRLLSRFAVEINDEKLTATCQGEILDPDRHQLEREVKAITYHQLKVQKQPNGWLAEVIVDI